MAVKPPLVSLSGVLLPLLMGGMFAFFLYPQFAGPKANLVSFMLLVGTAMAITAFPVLARLLEDRRMLTTKIGALALLWLVAEYSADSPRRSPLTATSPRVSTSLDF